MPTEYIAESPTARKAALEARVKALIAQNPNTAKVAGVIQGTHTGEQGGFTQALVSLVRENLPKGDLLDGYAAARMMEFAGRKAYLRKTSAEVFADTRKHAANHLKLAMAAIAEQSARKAAEAPKAVKVA